MTKRYFPDNHTDNEGADIPGSAGKGGGSGPPIRPCRGADPVSRPATGGLGGGADPGNTGAGIAGGDVEVSGVVRTPDDAARHRGEEADRMGSSHAANTSASDNGRILWDARDIDDSDIVTT